MPGKGTHPQHGLKIDGQRKAQHLMKPCTALLKILHQRGRNQIVLVQNVQDEALLTPLQRKHRVGRVGKGEASRRKIEPGDGENGQGKENKGNQKASFFIHFATS